MNDDQENKSADATTRKMVVSAIDEDYLILEEPDTGYKITWPLNKIPKPFNLGNELSITLECSTTQTPFSSTRTNKETPTTNSVNTQKPITKEDQMRRLLEDLVN